MELFVIRNKKQLQDLKDQLEERRLPFKLFIENIYPIRSLDLNAYYWGIVLKYISDASGHTIEECHDGYKRMFDLKIEFIFSTKKQVHEPVLGVGSTSAMNNKIFIEYIFKVRIDGELNHNIVIPNPNECFVPELDYKHDTIQSKRL